MPTDDLDNEVIGRAWDSTSHASSQLSPCGLWFDSVVCGRICSHHRDDFAASVCPPCTVSSFAMPSWCRQRCHVWASCGFNQRCLVYLPTMWLTSSITNNPSWERLSTQRRGIMCNQNGRFRKEEGFREGSDIHPKCPWRWLKPS